MMEREPVDIKEEKVPHDTMIERKPVDIKKEKVPHDTMIERKEPDRYSRKKRYFMNTHDRKRKTGTVSISEEERGTSLYIHDRKSSL